MPLNSRPLSFVDSKKRAQDFREFLEDFDPDQPPRDAFPASFLTQEGCSATLIGPRVLLTAGHCFEGLTSVHLKLQDGRRFDGECTTAGDWSPRLSADVALCLMKEVVPVRRYETVWLDPRAVSRGDHVLLTGFGGSEHSGLPPGTHLVGTATVVRLEGTLAITDSGAWLRDSDSGGAGFVRGSSIDRLLVSVNASSSPHDERESRLELLSKVSAFLEGWASQKKVAFCSVEHPCPRS